MGQSANGILYGCEAPDFPETDDYEELPENLVLRWEKANKITWSTKGPRIRIERDGGKTLIGIWIAVGGSGVDDAPYFLEQCILLSEAKSVYANRIKAADKLWVRFTKHVWKKEKITLGLPELWLTPTETA